MARYTGAVCKICRAEQAKLFLKGDRCFTTKCSFEKRPYKPGLHGQSRRRRKVSDYGTQLREKQKVRKTYGLLEKQFRSYYERATRMIGVTGTNLLRLLEGRLDNLVFRMGFATSRNQARQMVRHGHVLVNGKRMSIPSFHPPVTAEISIPEKSSYHARAKEAISIAKSRGMMEWVSVDEEKVSGTYMQMPDRAQLPEDIQENLIVEFYSR